MNSTRRKLGRSIILVSFVCVLLGGSSRIFADETSYYKFGVFPFMPMSALIKYYNSVSTDFTRQVNKRVIAQTRPTFKMFVEEIQNETYDVIFIQPFDYPLAFEHHYRPLARRIEILDAILVTKLDSNIKSITDLIGKTLASPPEESAISNVIKKEFMLAGITEASSVHIEYTSNHFACIQMVLVGSADACSTTTPVLEHWQNSRMKKKKLRIIHQANAVPHTVYMVHQRMPQEDQEKFKQAILTWNERPAGKMILKTFSLEGFVEAKDADYDVIRNFWK